MFPESEKKKLYFLIGWNDLQSDINVALPEISSSYKVKN